MQFKLDTREVSQLDGLPVSPTMPFVGDRPGMVRVFVAGYQSSMLFWPDEIVPA